MKYLKQYLVPLLFCGLLSSPYSHGQTIWPGDVNNNGIVNGVDLLYWGVAFGSSGPARAETSGEWLGVPTAEPWAQNFVDGRNYAYADCDGSGIIDQDDFDDAIEDNFGQTHGDLLPDGYLNGIPGNAPRLRLEPDAELVGFGATVNISLSLDDSEFPVGDFYGIALKFSYTTGLLADDDGLDFELAEDNWIEADNSYVQDLFIDNDGLGQAELAISRTNQQNIPVLAGEIGNISIVIEDIIVGREIDTFLLRIDSVLLMNGSLGAIPLAPDSAVIVVAKDPVLTATDDQLPNPDLKVYPNPVRDEWHLESAVPIHAVRLADQLGRSFPLEHRQSGRGHYLLRKPQLPAGLYWLSVRTPAGWIGKKIIFSN